MGREKPFFPANMEDDHLIIFVIVFALPLLWLVGAWGYTALEECCAGGRARKRQRYED